MSLPEDLYSDDVAYRIRVCLLVEENPLLGLWTGSKIHLCDGCSEPIWVDENQEIPPMPAEYAHRQQKGDLCICKHCMKEAQKHDPDGGEPVFLREQDKKLWDQFGQPWLDGKEPS